MSKNNFPALIKSQELPPVPTRRTPSPEIQTIRPRLVRNRARAKKQSDNFSWDPNSKRSSSRGSGGGREMMSSGRDHRDHSLGVIRQPSPAPPSRLSSASSNSSSLLRPEIVEIVGSTEANMEQQVFSGELSCFTSILSMKYSVPLHWTGLTSETRIVGCNANMIDAHQFDILHYFLSLSSKE